MISLAFEKPSNNQLTDLLNPNCFFRIRIKAKIRSDVLVFLVDDLVFSNITYT